MQCRSVEINKNTVKQITVTVCEFYFIGRELAQGRINPTSPSYHERQIIQCLASTTDRISKEVT